jgi:hypothetical protein
MYYHNSRNMLIIGPDDQMARNNSDDDDDEISEGMDTPPSTDEEVGECEVSWSIALLSLEMVYWMASE